MTLSIAKRRVINAVARGDGARRGREVGTYDALERAGLIEYGHDADLGFSIWRLTDDALRRFLSATELETLSKQRALGAAGIEALRSADPPLTVRPDTQTSSSAPADGTTRRSTTTMPLTDRQVAVATAVHAGAKTAGEARKHKDVEKLGLGPGDTLGVLRGLEKRGIVKLTQATKSAPVTVKYTSDITPAKLREAEQKARDARVAAAKEAKAKAAPKKAPAAKKATPAKAPAKAKGATSAKKAAPKAKATTAKGGTVTPIDAATKAKARQATAATKTAPGAPAAAPTTA